MTTETKPTLARSVTGDPHRVIAGRYRLEAPIGRGGHGEVWRAHDDVLGETVAVKLIDPERSTHEGARIQREAASLRLLRMPGVVRLLDDGVDGDSAFFVMELVSGVAFPGRPSPCAWSELAGPTLALLETLDRIHAAGVVHRDLKPGNVLVGPDGRTTVLDFGISRMTVGHRDDLTARGALLGTPNYLAPEQIRGARVGPAADLYAVGVMLHHALSGRLPHEALHAPELFRSRLSHPAPPLRERATHVPHDLARVVDRLLEIEPSRRPPTARAVLALLRGEPTSGDRRGRWLGARDPIDAASTVLAAGGTVVVVGGPGSGRTRALEEIAAPLATAGRLVVVLPRSERPFSSVAPLVEGFDDADSLDAIEARVDEALDRALASGTVIVCDDWELLDSRTRRAIGRRAPSGRIAIAANTPVAESAHVVRLTPIPLEGLRAIFGGHDRLFHLRTDAAALLHRRTEGVPLRVVRELEAWARAGMAREDGDRVLVDRDGLEAIEGGLTPIDLGDPGVGPEDLPSHLVDIAIWIALAGEQARPQLLARTTGEATWRIEAAVEELVEHGVARSRDGVAGLRRPVDPEQFWPAARVQDALRAIVVATAPGAPGRLLSLLAVSDGSDLDVASEALAAAEATKSPRRAVTLLQEGMRALRFAEVSTERAALRDRILAAWFERISTELAPRAADRFLYELERESQRSDALARLSQLARALLEVSLDPPRALDRLDALGPSDDLALERRRAALRMIAARSTSEEREASVLADVSAWAEQSGDAETLARLDGWRGRWAYRKGEYAEAARLHFRAAAGLSNPLDRMAAHLNGAWASLDAFDTEAAVRTAREVLALANDARHPLSSAQAEWIERTARYRLAEALAPDTELVDATRHLDVPLIVAPVALTEAAIAWRAGEHVLARTLALEAETTWRAARLLPEFRAVARALAVACGEPATEAEARAIVDEVAPIRTMGATAQLAGLLAIARPSWRRWLAPVVDSNAETVPRERWSTRLDVISIDEAFDATREDEHEPSPRT